MDPCVKTPLFLIPIEPLPERYTESWYRNFPIQFANEGFDVTVIDGTPLNTKIEVGSFLDINSTIAYKSSQMAKIAQLFFEKKVPQGAHFYFMDVEFWGIESLRLMADMNKVKIYISGFLHAASYTRDDAFSIAEPYQKYTEMGWIAALDIIFVGSEYHKECVWTKRIKPQHNQAMIHKISVVSNPIFPADYKSEFNGHKKKQIILPNRVDWGKRPDLSFTIAALFKEHYPDWTIVVTTGKDTLSSDRSWLSEYAYWLQKQGVLEIRTGLSKSEYHDIMEESAIMLSTSIEENFGYCIAEAIHHNVIPVLRDGLSHKEFGLPSGLLFKDEDNALGILNSLASEIEVEAISTVIGYNIDHMSVLKKTKEREQSISIMAGQMKALDRNRHNTSRKVF